MEESWINLQQQIFKRSPRAEEECDDVISGSSTGSSAASSTESVKSPKEALSNSGSTDENLRASFNTLLKNNPSMTEEEKTAAEEKHRRDTITPASRPSEMSRKRKAEDHARKARKREREEEERSMSYWSGFYAGISVGLSSMLVGLVCWRFARLLGRT